MTGRKVSLKIMENWLRIIASLVFSAVLAGCAGMSAEQKAAGVRLLSAAQVTDCTKAGSTQVSVQDRLHVLEQVEGGLQRELTALARRSAVQLGGNAIVAIDKINRGSQSFAVYRCPATGGSAR